MSEKGRFNAAITILELEEAKLSRGLGHPQISDEIKRNLTPMLFDYRAAIRVLEAAGKVDKEGGLKFIHACGYPIFPYPKNARQIRALLEALPDKEEK